MDARVDTHMKHTATDSSKNTHAQAPTRRLAASPEPSEPVTAAMMTPHVKAEICVVLPRGRSAFALTNSLNPGPLRARPLNLAPPVHLLGVCKYKLFGR